MRHLMSPLDFSVEELDKLMDLANDIEVNRDVYKRQDQLRKEPFTWHLMELLLQLLYRN